MSKKIILLTFCTTMFTCLLFSIRVFAKDEAIDIKGKDKTLYSNISVSEVCKEFADNAYRASNKYKDYSIGLIGTVKAVASSGKSIELSSEQKGLNFVCDTSSKALKTVVEEVSSDNTIIVCGKVTGANENEFKVKATLVIPIKGKIETYSGGTTFSDGTIFLKTETKEESIGNYCYKKIVQWDASNSKDTEETTKWNEIIGKDYENPAGEIYTLSEDEWVGVYRFDWNDVKIQAQDNMNGTKEWKLFEENRVEEYMLTRLIPYRMKYGYDIANRVKTTKNSTLEFDYFPGSSVSANENIHAEAFFIKDNDDFIAFTYVYGDKPEHTNEVAFMLSTLTKKTK